MLIARSAERLTVVVAVAVLGSALALEAVAVLVMTTPFAALGLILTTRLKALELLPAMLGVLQLAVPVAPTAGGVQIQPGGLASDWKVVLAGMASLRVALLAAPESLLLTVMT